MTYRELNEETCLPRLGRIRLGIKDIGESSPWAVDYFVCPDPVKKIHGDRPQELPILLVGEEDSRRSGRQYFCFSNAGNLVCKGDGQKASALVDSRTGSLASRRSRRSAVKEIDCRPDTCPHFGGRCRRVMSLRFLLPHVPGLGVWQIDTASFRSIANVNGALHILRRICGRVSLMPLILRIQPCRINLNGEEKEIHVLALDTPFNLPRMLKCSEMPLSATLLSPGMEQIKDNRPWPPSPRPPNRPMPPINTPPAGTAT